MIVKTQFKNIAVGQIFYTYGDDTSNLHKCMKCVYFDPDMIREMETANEWVDTIMNATWLEPCDDYSAGTFDYFPENAEVWVNEESRFNQH